MNEQAMKTAGSMTAVGKKINDLTYTVAAVLGAHPDETSQKLADEYLELRDMWKAYVTAHGEFLDLIRAGLEGKS